MVRQTPLDRNHRADGAKMVTFSGWELPLSYPAGTLTEHRTCRNGGVVFDVSHLGSIRLFGPNALSHLQANLSNDLSKIEPGRAQYTHLLDDSDGSVVDDLIVWWVAADEFHVIANAANTRAVCDVVGGDDITHTRALIAVQGPEARRWLADVAPEAAAVGRFHVGSFRWDGARCLVAGTGYTGEDGVEISVPAPAAASFWETLLDAGFLAAGLGARDTLRLEAAFPLHGHELGPGITPLQADLEWVVAWQKGTFRGREALDEERRRGVDRRLMGLEVDGRQPPRAGYEITVNGDVMGTVTSGNFSPTLGRGIALAFLPPHFRPGGQVIVDTRGQAVEARVVETPFVRRRQH